MPDPSFRFGPFVVDRTGYRVLRDGHVVDLTPKLLDLLLFLLDHAGTLVTKEQLLDGLWPDANVTENALAQAVSELRHALGDDAGNPQYIKTVARRGYRFIGSVETVTVPPDDRKRGQTPFSSFPAHDPREKGSDPLVTESVSPRAIAVLDFTNVSRDPNAAWLSAGIAETVTADLVALDQFRVVDRWRVMEAMRRSNGTPHEIAAALGVPLAVVGSFQLSTDRIRITARIVDFEQGEAVADAKVDGPLASIFELQDRVVVQLSHELGFANAAPRRTTPRETPSLEAYRAFTEGWLRLETLDVGEIPRAIASFERAIAADKRYALAYTGLGSAQLALYETTRADTTPARPLLDAATANARHAIALDETLAEAHATLALILVSAWNTPDAIRAARRAVALEPGTWRHFFRLGHASWGDERLRAAAHTLALYPDFAFAHFQSAMVHVARGHLAEAETVLRQGAAVQDRQIERGERYPALGLHWLLGLVRLAQDDVEEAIEELDCELVLAVPHRLYGREYAMHVHHARGACFLRMKQDRRAADSFREALRLYPEHGPSVIGLALATRTRASDEFEPNARQQVESLLERLDSSRPVEAAVVRSLLAAALCDRATVGQVLVEMLDAAPAGFAGWTLPVEPLLTHLIDAEALRAALERLAQRAG